MGQSTFLKNVAIRFALTIPLRFRGLIILPLLTRIYPQETYGVWLQVLVISEIAKNLLSLQFGPALVRYLSGESNPEQTIRGVFTATLFISCGFLFLNYIYGDVVCRILFNDPGLTNVLISAAIWIVVQALVNIGLNVLRSQEKIGKFSTREILSAAWMVIAVIMSYALGLQIDQLILICAIGDAVLLLWILMQIETPWPVTSISNTWIITRRFMPFSAPLIISSLFLWFTRSIDRFLIVQILDLSAVAVYGVAFQLAALIFFVLQPINFVLFPKVSKAWNKGDMDDVNSVFSQAVTLSVIVSLPVVVGILLVSEGLITLLAGEGYYSSNAIVFFLLISCVGSMIYQNHLFVIQLLEKTYLLPILFIGTALLNLSTGYLLITHTGLFGAALARALTLIVMAIVITIWARRYIKFKLNWSLVLKVGAASIIMGMVIFKLPDDSWETLSFKIISGVTVFILSLLIFRVLTKENWVYLKHQF